MRFGVKSGYPSSFTPLFLKKTRIPPHLPPHKEGHRSKIILYNEDTKAKNEFLKGGRRMLEPITKKYEDGSTLEKFKFTFFCDSCGCAVEEISYTYHPPFKPKFFISKSEQRARELLWLSDHASAYDRANKEALLSFNRCPVCKRRVCDDCFDTEAGFCYDCSRKKA